MIEISSAAGNFGPRSLLQGFGERVGLEIAMPHRQFPVLVDKGSRRMRAGMRAGASEEPAIVALKLRDKGFDAYRICFDAEAKAWIAAVMDWRKHAA
jgi:hypothetical protein